MREVWIAFLSALTRFWDNRFRQRNPYLEALQLELEYSRREKERLLNALVEVPKIIEPVPNQGSDYKPIGGMQPTWSHRAQMLEQKKRDEARARRQTREGQAEAIEALEKELGVIQNG